MSRSQRPPWLGEDGRGFDHIRIHVQLMADGEIGAYEIAVYAGLAIHAEIATGDARPSMVTIAGYGGMSERRARMALVTLVERGWVKVTEAPGRASTYRLLPPPTPACDAGVASPTPAPDAGPPLHVVQPTPARGAAEQEPVNKNQITRENTGADGALFDAGANEIHPAVISTGFEVFWHAYPRRTAIAAARKAYAAALKIAGHDEIMTGVRRYASEIAGTPAKFIPHPATWLNAHQWLDEPGANLVHPKPKGAAAPITRRNQQAGRITL